ncbi:beta-ketoadipate enol-lactone hydrolase [Brucella melitensis bv. 1 str. Rev.1]|uniref:Beta-ketoadipate enol-lactone hydrolase n=2 Tax=Brucella TaxID=234 RepID=A0A7U8K6B5_BRUNE|nr:beta-ketoadipate enol-lactone hydrolase [Brucella abortus bv. 9 str. C68]EEY02593.1 beta-ketoadipate enol-lactone hydrolase [Brucella neotomae 5K33]EEZ09844.1 beta-ketoadipate enol-lactone hydrolase [Brucella melitensis bv. 3 str. Ether]EEZ13307.1 beta-ketoadipate enol-lactone hydrolase [Brucella melitensis bv. 1 str. Rev.1]EEZ28941.1 beta-ketoadipate enol-lactone hydrolase [Brucella pinnipedialis M292/94/1]
MVFINSLGTDFRIWNKVRARLGHDVSTLVYDKRGHGLSDIGKTPYTIELLAQDLIALLDRLSIHKAVICGLSVGGLIAQGLYAARPDLVAGLVLSNTAHKIGTPEMWNARIDAIMQNGLASILDATMPRWFTAAYRRPDNAAYQAYCNMFTRQPLEGYAATCAALRDADFTAAAHKISVPVRCVAGDQDGSTPPTLVQELASLIPGAVFSQIANSGHIPCVEQPDAYTALLRDFLSHNLLHGE